MRSWWCRLGLHRGAEVGLADYGRGMLWKCSRPGCPAKWRIEISQKELESELFEQVLKIKYRPRPKPLTTEADLIFDTWLDGVDGADENTPAPTRTVAVPTCETCRARTVHVSTPRCPNCGTRIKPPSGPKPPERS